MNWNKWVRQTHRRLSIAFTVAVVANIVAVVQKKYTSSVGLLAMFLLACSCSPVRTCSCCRMPPSGAAGDLPRLRFDSESRSSIITACHGGDLPGCRFLLTASKPPVLQSRHATKSHPRIRNQP